MKLAIRVTDPGNDAKWNFLFSVFNVASDDQSFLSSTTLRYFCRQMFRSQFRGNVGSAHTVSLWLILFKRRAKPTWSIQTVRAIF